MIFLTFSYAQHPKQNLNLNRQRKLEEKTNETILLGFENYNFSAPYEYVYFDTLFYLKNWNTGECDIYDINNNNLTIVTENKGLELAYNYNYPSMTIMYNSLYYIKTIVIADFPTFR